MLACALSAVAVLALPGCIPSSAKAAGPNPHCADLVAKAVTSYFNVKGSGHCVIRTDGSSPGDYKLAGFTVDPAPVFNRIDRSCGYHEVDHTFNYLVSNTSDRAAGRIIVLVDDDGWVLDVAKHLDRSPGTATKVACPAAGDRYSFA